MIFPAQSNFPLHEMGGTVKNTKNPDFAKKLGPKNQNETILQVNELFKMDLHPVEIFKLLRNIKFTHSYGLTVKKKWGGNVKNANFCYFENVDGSKSRN